MPDLTSLLNVPDAILQQQFPGEDIEALKEMIRRGQATNPTPQAPGTAPSNKPVTQTIKTDPNTGEQTMTVSGSVQDLSQANPLTPTVRPPVPEQTRPPMPVAPVNPVDAYNRYTAMAESGMRPDVGYHDPNKSSAYGTYGITAPQYQEIQRANPQFANRPITSLTPQEQTQANTTSRDVYAQQLRAKGIEPTEENLRLAHFLGAGGARQYLQSGAVNPEAAAANGGEARVRQIADARLRGPAQQGPVAPGVQLAAGNTASDVQLTPNEIAVQRLSQTPGFNPTVETPGWQQDILNAGNDPTKLARIMANDQYPEDARSTAKNLIVQSSLDQQQKLDAQKKLQGFAQGDPQATRDVMKLIGKQSEEGSYVKAVLFSQLGLNELAKQEQAKLGGPVVGKAILGGNSYLTETRNGVVVGAYDPKGRAVDEATLARINAESTPQGTHQYSFTGEVAVDPKSGQEVRQRQNSITGGVEYVYVTGPQAGQRYTGGTPVAKSIQTSAAKMDYGVISAYRKQFGTDALSALAQMQKDRGPMTRDEQDAFLNAYGFQAGAPGVGAVPQPGIPSPTAPVAPQAPRPAVMPQGGPAPVAPVNPSASMPQAAAPIPQAQPAPEAGMRPRGINESETAYNNYKENYKRATGEVSKAGGEVLATESEWKDKLDIINEGIKGAKGKNNLGTIGQGVLPGERAVGRYVLGSKDARNTDAALNAVKTVSAAGMKTLGANPTDADRDYLTKNIPDESWDAKDVADWLESRKKFVQRKIDIAREQVKSGGERNTPSAAPGTKENPIKLKI